MVKRSGVRTRTLGLGWEERFLAAVRKAREQKLIANDAAEKLRLLAGVYFCAKCKKEHRTESTLGKEHLRLQPAPAASPQDVSAKEKAPKRRALAAKREVAGEAALPVALTEGAKAGGAKARAKLVAQAAPPPQEPPPPPPGKRRGVPARSAAPKAKRKR